MSGPAVMADGAGEYGGGGTGDRWEQPGNKDNGLATKIAEGVGWRRSGGDVPGLMTNW